MPHQHNKLPDAVQKRSFNFLANHFNLKHLPLFFALLFGAAARSQTLGGAAGFSFTKLPASTLLTAMGGGNVSYNRGEVSLTATNPALLESSLNTQVNASFNAFFAGAKTYSLTGAVHNNQLQTSFGGHVYFVDYGSLPATDAAGNINGQFSPTDFVVQVSAARQYLQHWHYGATFKFINSSYQSFTSNALAVDIGLLYVDSARHFSAGLLAKNMGTQLKTFSGQREDLPFDLQAGFTQRLQKAPFAFSFTANHLHRLDHTYNDDAFNVDNGFSRPSSFDKIFNHFVLATHVYFGQNFEAIAGYNHLRRQELSVPGGSNGLAGFSAGVHLRFSKLQVQLARATYQGGISYTQLGLTVQLNKLGGLGN